MKPILTILLLLMSFGFYAQDMDFADPKYLIRWDSVYLAIDKMLPDQINEDRSDIYEFNRSIIMVVRLKNKKTIEIRRNKLTDEFFIVMYNPRGFAKRKRIFKFENKRKAHIEIILFLDYYFVKDYD